MSSECIVAADRIATTAALPLYSVAQLRALEAQAAGALPPHTLMQRAGLALARLTQALAPHARTVWIACGPGNNGGDGFEAAVHLQAWGKRVHISHHALTHYAQDAALSIAKARDSGVSIGTDVPQTFDVCIDALFGIGLVRVLGTEHAHWVHAMHASGTPIIAVDCPSGLDTDTGSAQPGTVHAHATLTFLGLKPGLFTNQGRDTCGDLWLDTLGVAPIASPMAQLNPRPAPRPRAHASHKGSFGDVAVVGGDEGMLGAVLLSARAALLSGAGRVYVAALDPKAPRFDDQQPELMFRSPHKLHWQQLTVVAGCGGGGRLVEWLPALLQDSARLVLDADALNAVAETPTLEPLLRSRSMAKPTVLTPHPLEAARLLGTTAAAVQGDRLHAAQALADKFQACVVLKGSGTVLAAPDSTPTINPTGNARLATAGSGDVLAGMVGAGLAAGQSAWDAAACAVYQHGLAGQDEGFTAPVRPASGLLNRH
ncbi:NAD(P)H-hydrate dehydratase [Curvibacter sp. APW13]|uniref:NAD(P)H-hydrate dehydratase n=1 Tax=Curvibacter sp. APW13 TaxID=3077236 RepID=UPI0028E04424|nr:NAD(P)H-hydrate dehydratase [Curvibacter sp. APW13]MDT8990980.1 NAD(P)H-hydrate dehydratase [Curvibacter sp. APW13]